LIQKEQGRLAQAVFLALGLRPSQSSQKWTDMSKAVYYPNMILSPFVHRTKKLKSYMLVF